MRVCLLGHSSPTQPRPNLATSKSYPAPQPKPPLLRGISNVSSHVGAPSQTVEFPVDRVQSNKLKGKKALLAQVAAQQLASALNPIYSNPVQTSFNWRSGRPMAGMLELERSRTRRERTFIGSECAVCEEPLEHTLRGERILQFSCGHVSHEACFYEYIKEFDSQYCPTCNAPLGLDTSRGGNVLDLGKFLPPSPACASRSDASQKS